MPIGKEFMPFGTSKTSFGSRAPVSKEFKPIGTGKTSFISLAPIGKESPPKGASITGFRGGATYNLQRNVYTPLGRIP